MKMKMKVKTLWPGKLFFCLCVYLLGHDASFSYLQAEPIHNHDIHCSRERSRTAWNVIDEYLLPFVKEAKYNIPEACRLHPNNDIFREQEMKKEHISTSQWQCSNCKKMFRSEKYLDQHLDNRHRALLNYTRERCLADMCGALHCDYYDTLKQAKYIKRKCSSSASGKNLHLCESLANTCFPPKESATSRRLHDFFLRQFCDAHKCKKGVKPFARGNGRSGDRALYIALFVFICMILLLYYGGIYAHIRELSKNHIQLKRIQKLKPHQR